MPPVAWLAYFFAWCTIGGVLASFIRTIGLPIPWLDGTHEYTASGRCVYRRPRIGGTEFELILWILLTLFWPIFWGIVVLVAIVWLIFKGLWVKF